MYFLGGPEIYGVGYNNNETILCRLQEKNPNASIINRGAFHMNINHVLAFADSVMNKNSLEEFVYIIKSSDLDVIVGSKEYIRSRGDKSPYYKLKNDSIYRESNFLEGRSVITGCFKLIFKSKIMRKLDLSYYSDQFKLEKLKKAIQYLFDHSRCTLIIANSSNQSWTNEEIIFLKDELNCALLDYSDLSYKVFNQELFDILDSQLPSKMIP